MERELHRSVRRRYHALPSSDPAALVAAVRDRGLNRVVDQIPEAVGIRLPQLEPGKMNTVGSVLTSGLANPNAAEALIRLLQDALLDEEEDRKAAELEERELRAAHAERPLAGAAGELEGGLLVAWGNLAAGPRVGPHRRLVTRVSAAPGRVLEISLALSGVWSDTSVRSVSLSFDAWPGQMSSAAIAARAPASTCASRWPSPSFISIGPRRSNRVRAGDAGVGAGAGVLRPGCTEPHERVLWKVWHDEHLLPRIDAAIQKRRHHGWTAGRAAKVGVRSRFFGAWTRATVESSSRWRSSPQRRRRPPSFRRRSWSGSRAPQSCLQFTRTYGCGARACGAGGGGRCRGLRRHPTLDGDGASWPLLKRIGPHQRVLVDDSRHEVVLFEMSPHVEAVVRSLHLHGTRFSKAWRGSG